MVKHHSAARERNVLRASASLAAQMELTNFGQLRRNQRRISKSTIELRDFGQYQALFSAQSEDELLQQSGIPETG